MNKQTRMKIYKAFVAAKDHLVTADEHYRTGYDETKSRYICFALSEAWRAGKITHAADWAASQVVTARLVPHSYVEDYLKSIGVISSSGYLTPDEKGLVQDFRHLWLDALIKEFSA